MAILETTIKRFIGTSREEKPYPGMFTADGTEITAANLPAGSTFMVKDPVSNTVDLFHWTGREWVSGDSPEISLLKQINSRLGELVEAQRAVF